ncbi:MAG: DUF924 domain-containing protein [Gammaproteobacteria bacterium]|nr:DUF924 domain-containing protein [Gammaproteobacteria bacterium]MDH5801103.1 DUF924 domain-containing protein [Gammaproteobacteria bacterium]
MQTTNPEDILQFWYKPENATQWFSATSELDVEIRIRYLHVWKQALDGKLDNWKDNASGCLALCIILDQFPLHIFRGSAKSYSSEAAAIDVAKHAIRQGFNKLIPDEQIAFLYMPLMHSENKNDQELSVKLFESTGLKESIKFARHHRDLIQRFGRFPHRNKILGRESTLEELSYLESKEAFTG